MTYSNVADLSSAQRNFDAVTYKASGRTTAIIKITEGTGYHFAIGDQWASTGLKLGLTVGRYHFAGDSMHGILHPADVEADYFLSFAGNHTPGQFVAVDFENPLVGPPLYGLTPAQAAAWCDEFLAHCAAKGGWPGVGYSMEGDGVVQLLAPPYFKWYAAYPGPVPGDAALHQFTDAGPVPGVGNCDDSYCLVDLPAFAGRTTPIPEEDMLQLIILNVPQDGGQYVWNLNTNHVFGIPNPPDSAAMKTVPVWTVDHSFIAAIEGANKDPNQADAEHSV